MSGGHSLSPHQQHGGQPPAQRKGLTPKVIIAISVAATVVLIGALIAASVVSSRDSVEDGARRYFDALGKTYSDELADHVVNVPDAASLEEARKAARSQDYVVKSVKANGSTAIVNYSVAGRDETVELEMRKVDGTWKVVDGFSKLSLSPDRKGVDFTVGYSTDPVGDRTIYLYPGTYELQKDYDTSLSTSLWDVEGDRYITLKPGESKALDLKIQLNDRGNERVRSSLGSAFSRCMIGNDVAPAGCPFSVPAPSDRVSTFGTWSVAGANRYEVAQRAEIAAGQEFNNVCATFNADVTYEYRNSAGFQKVPAETKKFTGCVDLTQRTPTVTWK
ncbi:MAG: hypothetical protein Q4G46_05000 [Propionibacteriaceae bacterium]|nr:hypothetical protein [Propionibacteriaceae bacterium]